jgi:ribosome-interacting GTPase 1
MSANLTPQYKEAEARFRAARETHEKLEALEEMLTLVPKHKGTEKIQADIKRRISKLKSESQKKGKAAVRHADPFVIRREGAGQVVLLGPPNSGKSSILAALTRATTEIALYPYTTHKPVPGMMRFEDAPIQLVDSPPVTIDFMEAGMTTLLRSANVITVVADLASDDPVGPIEEISSQLEKHQINLCPPAPSSAQNTKRALWCANKSDSPNSRENLELLGELVPRPWLAISAETRECMDVFVRRAFEALDVIRIYTKPPGKKADMEEPTILKKGATVTDAAVAVHREFADHLRFVRLWRSAKTADEKVPPSGIKVDRDFVLIDGDIVELHVEKTT